MVDARHGFSGMTVNERLFMAGLSSEFDSAIVARDRVRAVEVLEQVDISPDQAALTVDTTLNDPVKYGYPP